MTISTGTNRRPYAHRRRARTRHYIMTAPTFFGVDYAINPWMDTGAVVDRETAVLQWTVLRDVYCRLGHKVEEIEPVSGLPDMVYAANAGFVVGGTAVVSRFKHHQRAAESVAYAHWFGKHGYVALSTDHVNEGQGDLLLVGTTVLAGSGFRTERAAHAELAGMVGLPVISLELVDPRFYHLDTALAVLDDTTIAYYPPAFSAEARARLAELFPDAIVAHREDADVLGLNCASDGRHVVHPVAAVGFAEQLRAAGFEPVGVDVSELLKGGGAVKCCTLEVYP